MLTIGTGLGNASFQNRVKPKGRDKGKDKPKNGKDKKD